MQSPATVEGCPLCGGFMREPIQSDWRDLLCIACGTCGTHWATRDAIINAKRWRGDQEALGRIGYAVWRIQEETILTARLLDDIERGTKLPPAHERVNNVLAFMASGGPGALMNLVPFSMTAVIGADSWNGAIWAVKQAYQMGLIDGDESPKAHGRTGYMINNATLTVQGWEKLDALMRDGHGSRTAFMAMAFQDDDLWRIFRDHMRPAVKAAGFELATTADAQKTAGNIIARMKVEIRTSRFMVCDLTHGNRGAYWEAGFAEGIGRPVIYTCRTDVLASKAHPDHPHFDTAQQLIIRWDPANPGPGMQDLKDVIRATLPAEAKMTDG